MNRDHDNRAGARRVRGLVAALAVFERIAIMLETPVRGDFALDEQGRVHFTRNDNDEHGRIGCWCGAFALAPAAYDALVPAEREAFWRRAEAFWRRAEACEECRQAAVVFSATLQRKGARA